MGNGQNDLSLDELHELIEFGKFGFKGTLWSGIVGMALVLALAVLDAFTDLELGAVGLIGIALLVLTGVVAFGYFSLRKLPAIDVHITKEGEIKLAARRS